MEESTNSTLTGSAEPELGDRHDRSSFSPKTRSSIRRRVSYLPPRCQGIRPDILFLQEIRSYEQPTRIANAPAFLKGVVNLRGVIVPIVDLRLMLGCDSAEYNHFTVVIVLNLRGRVVGAVVDSVSDVIELGGDAIRPAPATSGAIDTPYITGIGQVGERTLTLINIETLMSSLDIKKLLEN